MPRTIRKVLEKVVAPAPVTLKPRVAGQAPQKKSGEPQPYEFSLHSQKLHNNLQEKIASNEPHFPIGGKQVWFPWKHITLLPPSARMTPYQAQFQVPLNFNKLDLRDYLWNVYGLRALNITTQLKHSRWVQDMPRYRSRQVKKMIIDMDQPFIWPEMDEQVTKLHRVEADAVFREYGDRMGQRFGSDLKKPLDEVANGVLGPYPEPARGFVSKQVEKRLTNNKSRAEKRAKTAGDEEVLREFLKL